MISFRHLLPFTMVLFSACHTSPVPKTEKPIETSSATPVLRPYPEPTTPLFEKFLNSPDFSHLDVIAILPKPESQDEVTAD